MKTFWKIFTDTNKEKNAKVIFSRIKKTLPLKIENHRIDMYKDKSYVIMFNTAHNGTEWSQYILDLLKF